MWGSLVTWEGGGKKGRVAQEGERACILFPSGPGIDLSSLLDRVQEGHFALASVIRFGESDGGTWKARDLDDVSETKGAAAQRSI